MTDSSHERIRQVVDRALQKVFGTQPGEIAPDQTFAGDLMAESLDYIDLELHLAKELEFEFDLSVAADEIRAARDAPVRVRDLVDWLVQRAG